MSLQIYKFVKELLREAYSDQAWQNKYNINI